MLRISFDPQVFPHLDLLQTRWRQALWGKALEGFSPGDPGGYSIQGEWIALRTLDSHTAETEAQPPMLVSVCTQSYTPREGEQGIYDLRSMPRLASVIEASETDFSDEVSSGITFAGKGLAIGNTQLSGKKLGVRDKAKITDIFLELITTRKDFPADLGNDEFIDRCKSYLYRAAATWAVTQPAEGYDIDLITQDLIRKINRIHEALDTQNFATPDNVIAIGDLRWLSYPLPDVEAKPLFLRQDGVLVDIGDVLYALARAPAIAFLPPQIAVTIRDVLAGTIRQARVNSELIKGLPGLVNLVKAKYKADSKMSIYLNAGFHLGDLDLS